MSPLTIRLSGSFNQGGRETEFKNNKAFYYYEQFGTKRGKREVSPTGEGSGYKLRLTSWRSGRQGKVISNKRNESTPHTQQKREVHTNKILNAHAHKGSPPPPRRTTATTVSLQLYEKEAQPQTQTISHNKPTDEKSINKLNSINLQ